MKKEIIKHIFMIILLVTFLVASIYYVVSYFIKSRQEKAVFNNLEKIATAEENQNDNKNVDDDNSTDNDETNENDYIENFNNNTTNYSTLDLNNLKNQNDDLIGWIKIDGTNINYPVMQNGQFYLKRNFYKQNSAFGTPFLAEQCNLETSDNLIIYGPHMNNKTMFSSLDNYKSYNYYQNHKYIKFHTIENGQTKENIYEVCFALKTTATEDGFKYYWYDEFYDIDEYNEFIHKCDNLKMYDTTATINYGDKFITLSTCEYSQRDGRMIVVARKI